MVERTPRSWPPETAAHEPAALPERIGQRYRVLSELGRGGMASVYEVLEEATGRRLAVKQLHAHRALDDGHLARLFELEFHTLTQLAHPRVVAVYDYQGLSEGPCYSMELLEGGDLQEQGVLPWRQVCALLRDVCSALSLLHSRRLVHRDVTPRNIRLTRDGKAKLIDFGAMAPFGTHKHPVGTPTFTAPEAVHGQALDGRADLFSLGATAYFVLTGRHAYPSRNFAGIRNAWRTQPALPSRYVEDIPPELDQLVMSLLSLAVGRRPASAAAVIERLSAIAGLQSDEPLLVQRSFLSTPTLVGRDAELQQIRRQMIQASRARGGAMFITGPRGVGCSRMVEACALEAKLANATLLRADASDARAGEWGGVRSLLDQLLIEVPGDAGKFIAPHAATLAAVWPRALAFASEKAKAGAAEPTAQPERSAVHRALMQLMQEVSRHGLLVVMADDLDQVDEPTCAFLALLAQQVSGRRMLVVGAAAEENVAAGIRGLTLLLRDASTVALKALAPEDCERLLISIFGDVANVRLLASRLYEVSRGSPATTMQLCQHLLDRDIITFRDGSWILPATIDRGALPNNLSDALRARLVRLDPLSRLLGQAFAMCEQPSLSLEQCRELMPEPERGATLHCLDALVAADVVRASADQYSLAHPAWAPLLLSDVETAQRAALHACIADMFLKQSNAEVRAAGHLLECGRDLEAIELVLAHVTVTVQKLHGDPTKLPDQLRQLPANWLQTVGLALQAAVRLNLPQRNRLSLQLGMLALLAIPTTPRTDIAREVVQRLYVESGLRDYAELTALPPPERLTQAIAHAQTRYDETPEHERGLSPAEAIPALARSYTHVIGMVGASADLAFMRELPSLTPFVPLSPAIEMVQLNVESTRHMMAGRYEQAHIGYLRILEMVEARASALPVPPTLHHYMRLAVVYGLAIIETITGRASAEARLQLLERDPLFEVNAWRLRANAAYRQGNTERADLCIRKTELLRIRNAPSQFFQGAEAWYEAVVFSAIGDVARLHTTLARLERMASLYPNWLAGPLYARGQIQRLRGEAEASVETFSRALPMCAAGEMASWLPVARGYLEALVEAGRAEEACERGAALLEEARAAQLTATIVELHYALAKAELAAGDSEAALAQLRIVDELREKWPIGNVFGAACYELRARIAIVMVDGSAFENAARQCNVLYSRSKNPALISRYERLLMDAERVGFRATTTSLRVRSPEDTDVGVTERLRKVPVRVELAQCAGPEERARRVLTFIAEHAAAQHVMLYLLREHQLVQVAATDRCPVNPRMDLLVAEFLADEFAQSRAIDPDDVVTTTVDNSAWTGPTGVQFVPALLSHVQGGQLAVTGVLVFDIEGQAQPSDELLSKLSAALASAGDVQPVLAAVPARSSDGSSALPRG